MGVSQNNSETVLHIIQYLRHVMWSNKKENMAEPSIREGTNAEDLNTGTGK